MGIVLGNRARWQLQKNMPTVTLPSARIYHGTANRNVGTVALTHKSRARAITFALQDSCVPLHDARNTGTSTWVNRVMHMSVTPASLRRTRTKGFFCEYGGDALA